MDTPLTAPLLDTGASGLKEDLASGRRRPTCPASRFVTGRTMEPVLSMRLKHQNATMTKSHSHP